MYHMYINTPDGTIANCKPSQLVRAAIMPPSEYRRIRSHLCWKKLQNWEAEQRNEQIRRYKECSQNIVKTWRNTLVNKQLDRQEKRRRRLQSMEDHKNALYEKSYIEKENERRKKLEEVRTYFLLERDDIRAINSAYAFTEILRERQEQLKYKEKMLAKEMQSKEEYDNRVKQDVECFIEKQKGAWKEEQKSKLKRKKELIAQLRAQNEKYEIEFGKEKELEKEDLLRMQEEMKLIEDNIREEVDRKRAICREDLLESRRNAEEKATLQKLIDEDQDKAIQIYLKYKRRIECLIKKQLERERKELTDRQEAIKKKVLESIEDAETHLQRWEDKSVRETEANAAEKLQKRLEKAERLRKERLQGREEALQEKQLQEEREKTMRLWEVALGHKRQEVDKIRELKRKEAEWEKKMETRRGYNAQIEEKRQKIKAEKQEALRELCLMMYDDSVVHEAFFKYANGYLEKARKSGSNEYPLVKEIENYRCRNGFRFIEKHDRRRKSDEERWKAPGVNNGPGADTKTDGLETALTVWQPQRVCPLVCAEGKVPEDNVCVSPRVSLNLPRIRSSDVCGQIKREILLKDMAEKGIK